MHRFPFQQEVELAKKAMEDLQGTLLPSSDRGGMHIEYLFLTRFMPFQHGYISSWQWVAFSNWCNPDMQDPKWGSPSRGICGYNFLSLPANSGSFLYMAQQCVVAFAFFFLKGWTKMPSILEPLKNHSNYLLAAIMLDFLRGLVCIWCWAIWSLYICGCLVLERMP